MDERKEFEAWLRIKPCGAAHDLAWEAWKARAALQSQSMPPEISRGLLDRYATTQDQP